jgi:putative hydrolase of the HAD superfamily
MTTHQDLSCRFRLVVFDMDDTLFPEIDYVRSGYEAISRYLATLVDATSEGVLARMWHHYELNPRTVFDAMLAELNLVDRVTVPALIDLYRSHDPQIYLRDEAPQVLTRLRDYGVRLGVVTDGPLVMQQQKARVLGLSRYVDRIILTDGLPPGCAKPSPVAFEMLMNEFAMPPAQCVYVADNPRKDFLGPRKLGWYTVQLVVDGGVYTSESAPPEGHPHVQIRSLREVLFL